MKVYQKIASSYNAYLNCTKQDILNEWEEKHSLIIEKIIENHLPSGSGFDNGTKFDWKESKSEKLVFITFFHHMNNHGYYIGWTKHKIIIKPNFQGFDIRVTGRNKNDIKEYIGELFEQSLNEEYKV